MELNQIIHGDCLEVLKSFPAKSVDLVVTSPPYNMSGNSIGNIPNSVVGRKFYGEYKDNLSEEDYVKWMADVIEECLRVSRYVMWNVQPVRGTRAHIADIQTRFAKNLKDYFIWNKHAVSVVNARQGGLAKGFEFVFMFGEDNKMIFTYNNFPENGYVPNRQEWYKTETFPEHHATFPQELPAYFIEYFTKEGDIVLDPFMGTGQTAVAAKKNNRKYIGIDISEVYVNIARERLKSVTTKLL